MRTTRTLAAVTATAIAITVGVGAASANPHADHPGADHPGAASASSDRLTGQERHLIHQATRMYREVEVAIADGYVPVGDCAELPGVGGMGYHYLHPGLASDTLVDPAQPELLVYVPDQQGRLRLGAVEYFVADADQDLGTDDDRPLLFGRIPFDGPMEGHEPGMPVHYDLHVWLYHPNPDGQLTDWNPRVTCP